MNSILVSVVIPCYNVEQYVQECVASVINQTYKNIEIICVDNNSTDGTWSVLIDIQKKHPNLILVKELKSGACAARNKGLLLAKGEWVQFLDADDLLLPLKIAHQVEMIRDHSIAFISAASIKRRINGGEVEFSSLNPNKYLAPFINQCGNTCSNLWNRRQLNDVKGWDEDLKSSQEADLMFRLVLKNNEFVLDMNPLTVIRERASGQISQRNPSESWKQYVDIRLNFMKELKMKLPFEYKKNKNIYVDFLLVSLSTLAQYNKSVALDIYNNQIKSEHDFKLKPLRSAFIKLFGFNTFLRLKNNFF